MTTTAYDKLASWPKQRPYFVTICADYTVRMVYICNSKGERLLAIPFDTWLDQAGAISKP